ncbi:C-24(28) sterol reductase [Tulasnella sp. UAMH 9824]|nr:C-24(28) sterol reductase [Tulasnella sp. UAMH 9824]
MSTAVLPLNGHSNGELRQRTNASKSQSNVTEAGRVTDKKLDQHTSYEFGGPIGVTIMIAIFPPLMYYFWICLWFYDGALVHPNGLGDIVPFFGRMWRHIVEDAYPDAWSTTFYVGLMAFQLFLAFVMPGYQQEGLPVPSLNYKTLMYNCNALACWYATLVTSFVLHWFGIFRLSGIVDHFGGIMTVSILWGFGLSLVTYWVAVLNGTAMRMSGNFMYDFWMGAPLNPRIGNVDLKMFQEVRIPWVLLFYICLSGACKQYDDYGYVSANVAFMVLATGLYINACAKGEECIPQTWDMFHEKDGFMLIFWNFAGVPFTYCYPTLYMVRRHPDTYAFPLWGKILLYTTLMVSHYIFDTSMAQKSHFKMQLQGIHHERWAFPQWPGRHVHNPTYVQTAHGNRLLTSGWWAYARKPNYAADWIQSFTWGVCAGFSSLIPFFYPVFFLVVLVHRCGRDFERCAAKYGKDWEEYCRRVPYKFIYGVY